MEKLKQENHLLSINTPFGKDVLILDKFQGVESISEPFSFNLEMSSQSDSLDPKKIIGQSVTITNKFAKDTKRFFNGKVSQFWTSGVSDGGEICRYQATVVPDFWLSTKSVDCKIYQEKSFKDILAATFGKHKIAHKFELNGPHQKHDYCVQFNESDFSFANRLMEEEGMLYYFEHSDGTHLMVITDDVNTFKDSPESEVVYANGEVDDTHITGWRSDANFTSGVHSSKNYDFETPSKIPAGLEKAQSPAFPDVLKHEVYQYPGESLVAGELNSESKQQVQTYTKNAKVFYGACNCYSFSPASKFKIKKSPLAGLEGKKYQITRTEYDVADDTHLSSGSARRMFDTRFTCIAAGTPFRSDLRHMKPKVPGLQSATVTGPKSEEIYVDKYGRVKVQFHWDRDGKLNEHSSCWIRVSQTWAGESWGAFFHPRIGDEVLVDFLDGDLDKPIVIGRVYNGKNKPFYPLPANKTKSGWKTQSTQKGSADHYNEISIEDKKGEEKIFLHAEKDYLLEVEKDEVHWVGQNRSKTIDKDETNHIKGKRKTSVDKEYDLIVGKNRTSEIKKSDKLTIADKLEIDVGKEIVIKTGSSSITMKSNGTIEISGVNVTVKGTKVDVKGSAVVNVKGGIVNIN